MVIVLSDDSDLEIVTPQVNTPSLSRTIADRNSIDIIEISITDDSEDQPAAVSEVEEDFLSERERPNTPLVKRRLKNVNNNQVEEHVASLNRSEKEKLFLNSDHDEVDSFDALGKRHNIDDLKEQNESDLNPKRQKNSSDAYMGIDFSNDSVFGNGIDVSIPKAKPKENDPSDIILLEISDSSDSGVITPDNGNSQRSLKVTKDVDDSRGNHTENSIMLKVHEVISDIDDSSDDNSELPCVLTATNNNTSDWVIKPHVDFLATIQINATDLDLQLREIHKGKLAKQRYMQANKVNRVFKQDIVDKELLMISNMDLTMKNNNQNCFYIQNGDLLIKKRESEYLKKEIKDLVRLIPDLKYATFTRRLTSVYELNSDIFLPIPDLLNIGNNLNTAKTKIDFVDVDMSESLFLINIQRLFEIFHFKEYTNVKKKFESYLLKNKKITLILTSFNKFKAKLVKWENSKQLQQFQSIHQGNETSPKKTKKGTIPDEYLSYSIKDVDEFILRLQMTYPTHVHCQIIETELTFINDWMLNYLKTILRRRYSEKKTDLHLKNKITTPNGDPFENFLLGLSGITQNNVSKISTLLGGNYQDLERNVMRMNSMPEYKGTEKKIINLMYKFIKSKHKDELL